MPKVCIFVLLLFICQLYASGPETLFENLEFFTDRTHVCPLSHHHCDAAMALDETETTYVSIFHGLEDFKKKLILQDVVLGTLSNFKDLKDQKLLKMIYYGIFTNSDETLIGLLQLGRIAETKRCYLGICEKIAKEFQKQGYASEVKKEFLKKLQKLKVIPTFEKDLKTSLYLGVGCHIHSSNKPSLKCNVIKCQFKIIHFAEEWLEVCYPSLDIKPKTLFAKPPPPLHDTVIHSLEKFLSPDSATSLTGELELKKISLQNTIEKYPSHPSIQRDEAYDYIVKMLLQYSQFLDDPMLVQSIRSKKIMLPEYAARQGCCGCSTVGIIPIEAVDERTQHIVNRIYNSKL